MSRFHDKISFNNYLVAKCINKVELVKIYNQEHFTNHKAFMDVYYCDKHDWSTFHKWVTKMVANGKLKSNGYAFAKEDMWVEHRRAKKEFSNAAKSERAYLNKEANKVYMYLKSKSYNTSEMKSNLENFLDFKMGVNNDAVTAFGKLFPLWEKITNFESFKIWFENKEKVKQLKINTNEFKS